MDFLSFVLDVLAKIMLGYVLINIFWSIGMTHLQGLIDKNFEDEEEQKSSQLPDR